MFLQEDFVALQLRLEVLRAFGNFSLVRRDFEKQPEEEAMEAILRVSKTIKGQVVGRAHGLKNFSEAISDAYGLKLETSMEQA